MNKPALTYDDIQLVPNFSNIKTRTNVSLKTKLSRNYNILLPIVGSPMDTVCEVDMALKLFRMGGVGCIHRFNTPKEQANMISELKYRIFGENGEGHLLFDWDDAEEIPIMAAIGVNDADKDRATELVKAGANVLLIDVAHGDHQNVIDMIIWCKQNLPKRVDIIAGNIATADAALRLQEAGADGLRVGIGGGCFTPHMKVHTENGPKEIQDIEIGDNVYTHTGELKRVINKFEYNNHKELMIINNIETTPNHKFYVIHKNNADLVTAENIHDYAEWITAENLTNDYFLIEL
jgi:IMP dehydrogenase/GMP reductase